jgi:hypothetical protein
VWAVVGVLSLAATAAVAQLEPSLTPVAWELKFNPTPPERIQVDTGKGLQTYWYMLYTVTNETGQDIDFFPEAVRVNEIESEATAEQAKAQPAKAPQIAVDPAIVGLQSKVFEAIKDRHKKTHPFLKKPVDAITKLLQGKDNALTSAIVFPDLDPRVSKFTIYVGGLSGETVTKPNPAYSEKAEGGEAKKAAPDKKADDGDKKTTGKAPESEKNPKFFVLRKTLALPYTLPGDPATRKTATPKLERMTWVMR